MSSAIVDRDRVDFLDDRAALYSPSRVCDDLSLVTVVYKRGQSVQISAKTCPLRKIDRNGRLPVQHSINLRRRHAAHARCGCLYDETCFGNLCKLRCPICHGTEEDCHTLCSDWHMSQARKVCAKVCGAEPQSCVLCGKSSFEYTLESPCGERFHESCYENWNVMCPGCGHVAEDMFSWNLRKSSLLASGDKKLLYVLDKLELK